MEARSQLRHRPTPGKNIGKDFSIFKDTATFVNASSVYKESMDKADANGNIPHRLRCLSNQGVASTQPPAAHFSQTCSTRLLDRCTIQALP